MKGRPAPERTIVVDGKPLPDVLDEYMVRAVVHGFYAKIRSDDLLGPIFGARVAADEWPAHLSKMCDFWSSTLLRTGRYDGRPLPHHVTIPDLGEAHFRRWLKLFRLTVYALSPPEVAALFMDRALRVAHSFRLAIAFHRKEDTLQIQPILEASLVEAGESKMP